MMDDVSLHSPVVRSSGPPGPGEMGQYTYEDREEAYTPRRIWPADHARHQWYGARPLSPRAPAEPAAPRQAGISHNTLACLAAVGLAIFACSTASLVIVAMLMDSTRGDVGAAASQIAGVRGALDRSLVELSQNRKQLAALLSLMDLWLGVFGVVNSTLAVNATAGWY
jgi:hypothetical protein